MLSRFFPSHETCFLTTCDALLTDIFFLTAFRCLVLLLGAVVPCIFFVAFADKLRKTRTTLSWYSHDTSFRRLCRFPRCLIYSSTLGDSTLFGTVVCFFCSSTPSITGSESTVRWTFRYGEGRYFVRWMSRLPYEDE